MRDKEEVSVVREWQRASNERNIARLLDLSDPDIEIVGPRSSVTGHEVLRDWLSRAGLTLETLRTFSRGDAVIMSQRGVWKSPETGEVIGEADVATLFRVDGGRVTHLARHDGPEALDAALEGSGLDYEDEVR